MILPFGSTSEALAFTGHLTEARRAMAEKLLVFLSFHDLSGMPARNYSAPLERLLAHKEKNRLLQSPCCGLWLEALGRWTRDYRASGRPEDKSPPPPLDLDLALLLLKRPFLREADVPPVIRQAIPPSHTVTAPYKPGRKPAVKGKKQTYEYALEAAIESAEQKCAGIKALLERYVSHFLILEKTGLRSCSANRYLGLVLVSTSDQSLIDLEESLVHELGHQVLYQLDRHQPVFLTHDDDRTVTLPWSGSKRNYYGFYHACYIYLFLRDYYRTAVCTHPFNRSYCKQRLDEIQAGLEDALPLLEEGRDLLTGKGEKLTRKLTGHIQARKAGSSAAA